MSSTETAEQIAANDRYNKTVAANPLEDRDHLLALAEILSKTGIVEIDNMGDNGLYLSVLCPVAEGRSWMSIWVLWHMGCRFTNYTQGGHAWDGSHKEAIEFLNLAFQNHVLERIRTNLRERGF